MFAIFFLWFVMGFVSKWMAVAGIPVFLILFLSKENYLALFLGFLYILILSDNLEYQTDFAKTFKNIYILFLAFLVVADKRVSTYRSDYFKLFMPFFFVAGVCLIFSPVVTTSIQKTLSYALIYMTIPSFTVMLYKRYGVLFLQSLLLLFMAVLVVGLALTYLYHDVAISHGERLRGIFGNPNGLGVFGILVAILLVLGRNRHPEMFHRHLWLLFWMILFFCVLKSGSRTALLAVMLLLLYMWLSKISGFLTIMVFLLMLVATEFVMAYSVQIIQALGLEEMFRLETLEQGSGRFIAWQFAWQNIQESLILGKGFAFDEYLMRSNFDYLSRLGHEGGVHNTYLIIWLNTGAVGLLLFLRGFFLTYIESSKHSTIAIPVMLTVMFSVNFEPWLASSLNPFTSMLLISISIMYHDAFQKKVGHE